MDLFQLNCLSSTVFSLKSLISPPQTFQAVRLVMA